MKIVVTNNQDFSKKQKKRLDSLGEVVYYNTLPQSADEYLERVKGADIICSGTAGLKDAYSQLKNVYITVGFVGVAFVNLDVLSKNNVKISNAPGINRHAVSEWITWMLLLIQRDFNDYLNRKKTYRVNGDLPPINPGLTDKNITILGKGNIAKQLTRIAKAFDMHVSFFKRGDDLHKSVENADVVVDTLSSNKSTHNLLNKRFFDAMKKDSVFISASSSKTYDNNALLKALDVGKLKKVALDLGDILVGDTEDKVYRKLIKHPNVFITPHIAYTSKMSFKLGMDVMIDNVEAWIKGKPQNLLNKDSKIF